MSSKSWAFMGRLNRATYRRLSGLTGHLASSRIRELRTSLQFAKASKNVRSLWEFGIGLTDDTRMFILSLLNTHGDLTATELEAALEVSQPAVAKQMRVLVNSGLVDRKQDGRWAVYSMDPEAAGLVLSEDPGAASKVAPSSAPVPLSEPLRSRLEQLMLERMFRGLTDPTRLYIVSLIRIHESQAREGMRATLLRRTLRIHRTTLAKHMHILVGSDWVTHKSRGRGVTYSLTEEGKDLFRGDDRSTPSPEGAGCDPVLLSEHLRSRMEEKAQQSVDGYVQQLRGTVSALRDHDNRALSQRLTLAISDRTRLLMLALINMYGKLTATELAAALNVSHATVSEHIGLLAGFVKGISQGKWTYYSMDNPQLAGMLPVRVNSGAGVGTLDRSGP